MIAALYLNPTVQALLCVVGQETSSVSQARETPSIRIQNICLEELLKQLDAPFLPDLWWLPEKFDLCLSRHIFLKSNVTCHVPLSAL